MFQIKNVKIVENRQIAQEMYLMKIEGAFDIKEGQFFMLKAPDADMTLYRPISVFDANQHTVSFLYSVRGKGTRIFSTLKEGSEILVHGPYGNGFPKVEGKVALIGGGIGMAPMLLTAKNNPKGKLFVGIRENQYTTEEVANILQLFDSVDMELVIGGIVADAVAFEEYDYVFTCGPEVMMDCISQRHESVYVSMERHMGCGVGACLSCSCKVEDKMKKVCQDGPVFLGKDVF